MSEPGAPAPRWLRQGDVFEGIATLPVATADGVEERAMPNGVAVITQTCDAVRPGIATIQVVPVVRLVGPEVSLAASGRSPVYAALPAVGPDTFARLDLVATVGVDMLVESDRRPGVVDLPDVRKFAQAVGRRYSRFAFPDDVASWLKPLQELAQRRARKQSPEGRCFAKVDEIRVRSHNGWSSPPYVLTISFIVRPGILPVLDDSQSDFTMVDSPPGSPSQIAEALESTAGGAGESELWDRLGRAWVSSCADTRVEGSAVVGSWDVEVVGSDEYTLEQYRDSERLDLDHLSAPLLSA